MELKRYKIRLWIDQIKSSLWITTGLMVLGSIALVVLVQVADLYLDVRDFFLLRWLHEIGPQGARIVLSTIAGTTITVAGVIFSITMVVLTMASSQFGPNLLREFLKSGHTQWTLGVFIGCFNYTLLTLSSIPSDPDVYPVPFLTVFVGILLGVASFLVLIYYIHGTVQMIRAPLLISRVGQDAIDTLCREFPEEEPDHDSLDNEAENPSGSDESVDVTSPNRGYVQSIEVRELLDFAIRSGCLIEMHTGIGRFVLPGQQVAVLFCTDDPVREDINVEEILSALTFGPERTTTQDAGFAVERLVEIAVRSLSPGINDPFTANHCIDQLGAALAVVGCRHAPPSCIHDENGQVRLRLRPHNHRQIVRIAIDQIRQHSVRMPAVSIQLMEMLAALSEIGGVEDFQREIRRQADLIHNDRANRIAQLADREGLESCYRKVIAQGIR